MIAGLLAAGVLGAQDRVADREAKVRAYLDRGKAYKAIAQCDAMLGRDPEPRFLALRAEAYNRLGEHDKAGRDARAAVRAFPSDAGAYLQLGMAEQGMGLADSAVAHLRTSISLRGTAEARLRLAGVLRSQGHPAAALAELELATKDLPAGDPRLAGLERARGECLATAGDTLGARAAFERSLAMAPDDPVTYNSRGWFLYALHGRHTEAVADYDRAIRLNPNYSYAFNNRGWSRYKLGDVDRGIADIEKARRRKAFNPYIYRNLGIIALEQGDRQRACDQFRKALGLGFTEQFGGEVQDLVDANCQGSAAPPALVKPAGAPRKDVPKAPPARSNAP